MQVPSARLEQARRLVATLLAQDDNPYRDGRRVTPLIRGFRIGERGGWLLQRMLALPQRACEPRRLLAQAAFPNSSPAREALGMNRLL